MSNMIPHARSTRDGLSSSAAGTATALVEPEGGFFRSHGPLLVAQGYPIVPITPGQKSPLIKGWPDRDFNHASPRAWHGHGVGIKAGRPNAEGHAVIGVDIDVRDPAIAAMLATWCREHVGDAPMRIGQAPKALFQYRASKPSRKKRSRPFRSPDGVEHAVEVLGTGQQFLAYAIHPGTGRPYTWPGAELVDTPIAELPEITEQQALDFIAYFEGIVPADWEPVTRARVTRASEPRQPGKQQRAPIWKLRLAMEVMSIDPETYDRWIRIGMALHHATGGSAEGFELWDQWSRKGQKYDGSTDAKWRTFGE